MPPGVYLATHPLLTDRSPSTCPLQGPKNRNAAPRLLYWEIDRGTITPANDVAAGVGPAIESVLVERPTSEEVEEVERFHSYLIGPVPIKVN